MYEIEIKSSCQKEIEKSCKKNPVLRSALEKKMNEIIQTPEHYKPLRYNSAGERRVHILKSFVLIFTVHDNRNTVEFLSFGHHDEAYVR